MIYDVFGMCNPLYDIQAEVLEPVLDTFNVQKGGMFLINAEQQKHIVAEVSQNIVNAEPGGSGANTMIGFAQLGGKGFYTGKIANDEHGKLYVEGLQQKNIGYSVQPGEGATGICVVLITPDAERTLCTYLGIGLELGPEDVNLEALRQSKYLYVTGYLWDNDSQKAAVLLAMKEAKKAGVKVALSLSDLFCVSRHKVDFLELTRDYVDLLIGNQDEAKMLTGMDNAHDAITATTHLCSMAAVTCSGDGSLLRDGDKIISIAPTKITPVDATGAGDMYAAGLLYGLTNGLPLEHTGKLASYLAAQVVAQLGPRLDNLDNSIVEKFRDA